MRIRSNDGKCRGEGTAIAASAARSATAGVHELRTRKMGDLIVVDAHLEVDGSMTVDAGHEIAVAQKLCHGRLSETTWT